MTFPHLPHRPSSEDDALDQTLNAWATNANHDPASDLAAEALEFHRWANDVRRTEPAATGPAAGTWNRVLRSTAQANRGGDMSSATISTEPQSAFTYDVRPWSRQQISRYLNVAVMLTIVFGVAFAGAFAAMQLNQPGNSNGQFALFGQTDQSATCDIEPLTVDRVMEIVKNPIPFMENGPGAAPIVPERPGNPMYADLYEPAFNTAVRGPREEPAEEKFDAAAAVVDAYLPCMVWGTVGQAYQFWSPLVIQQQVLAKFPVFADEDTVRTWIQDELDKPALSQNEFWTSVLLHYDIASVGTNPDRALSSLQGTNFYYFEEIITVGVSFQDPDGDTVLLTTATGNPLVSRSGTNGDMLVVTVGKPRGADNWFVISHYPHS